MHVYLWVSVCVGVCVLRWLCTVGVDLTKTGRRGRGQEHLDKRCNQFGLEVDKLLAGCCHTLKEKKRKGIWLGRIEINRILISYQNQVLHQIGQSTVGKHDKTCHRSGNTLSVAIGGARAVAAAVRIVCAAAAAGTAAYAVGSLITLLGLHAAREELRGIEW